MSLIINGESRLYPLADTVNIETQLHNNNVLYDRDKLIAVLSDRSHEAIRGFCARLGDLPKSIYAEALEGMGYLYECFDLMFALITYNIQATVDVSEYEARFRTVQNVLRPFASEYAIEPERALGKSHRKLFAEFYEQATGQSWPSRYPRKSVNPWLKCGRHWSNTMLANLQAKDLGSIDRAKYNLGYHWAVEYLSINEFDQLREAWGALGIAAPYLHSHCSVEEEHADCATAAVSAFGEGMIDDLLVHRGVRDHEEDLACFYDECSELINHSAGR